MKAGGLARSNKTVLKERRLAQALRGTVLRGHGVSSEGTSRAEVLMPDFQHTSAGVSSHLVTVAWTDSLRRFLLLVKLSVC